MPRKKHLIVLLQIVVLTLYKFLACPLCEIGQPYRMPSSQHMVKMCRLRKGLAKLASIVCPTSVFGAWSLLLASFTSNQLCMAKLASKHRTSNICLPTSKNVFDLNQKLFLLAHVQNVLAKHEMF